MKAKEIKERLKTGQPVEKWALATLIGELEQQLIVKERDYNFMKDLALAYEKALNKKPLSDEEIEECWKKTVKQEFISKVYRFDFARAIEERHGIK